MPLHIETHEIRVFKAVYDENGFKKAADKLFVTQSAVSQTIANLEHRLGARLFHRKPLTLTDTGTRLLHYAATVLTEEETLLDDLRDIKHGIGGTLMLAMNSTVNTFYGASLISRYCAEHPLTRLRIAVLPSRQIITSVGAGSWELGFGPFQQTMPDRFTTLPLFEDSRSLVIASSHAALQRSDEALLKSVPLIVSHLDDPDLRPTIDKLRDNFGSIWEISDIALRLELVQRGLGMTYLDQRALHETDKLHVLEQFPFSIVSLTFGLYYQRNRLLSSAARQFMGLCEELW